MLSVRPVFPLLLHKHNEGKGNDCPLEGAVPIATHTVQCIVVHIRHSDAR